MKKLSSLIVAMLVVLTTLLITPLSAEQAPPGARFQVTITKLTASQVFTPILVVSHVSGVGCSPSASQQPSNSRRSPKRATPNRS